MRPPRPSPADPTRAPERPSAAGWLAALQAFDALLDEPEPLRRPRLDALLARDPGLGNWVARLLAAHEAQQQAAEPDWLDAGPALDRGAAAAAGREEAPADGPRFGPWQLLREIGCGGMSRVWLARRADIPWAREVALKLPLHTPLRLHPDRAPGASPADPFERELHRRFVLERDLLSRLEHPHIARLYDAGFSDGIPWLALEFVKGEDLLHWCARRGLGLRERVLLFRQALQAVAYAHAALIVHRDIKPANLMVSEDGTLRLLDFGIGRLLDPGELAGGSVPGGAAAGVDAAAAATHLSQGRPMTPAYASPEQWRQEPLTTSTDVYSLGVVLYELLGGEQPFTRHGRDPSRLGPAIARGASRPASAAAQASDDAQVRAHADRLRGDLDAVIGRAMHPETAGRYASAAEFDADLGRWLEGRPVRARRASVARSLARTVRRHPWASGALAAGLLLVGTSGALALLQAREARSEQARAAATLGFVLRLFDQGDPGLHGGREVPVRELLATGEREIAALGSGQTALKAELQGAIARLWVSLAERPRATALRAERSDGLRRAGAGFEFLLARSLADEAEDALGDFRLADARRQLQEAEALLEAAGLPGPLLALPGLSPSREALRARSEVALRAAYLQMLDEAPPERTLQAFRLARDAARSAGDARSLRLATVELRQALLGTGRTDKALDGLLDDEAALREADPALGTAERLHLRSRLLDILRRAGELARAWPAIERLAIDGEAQYGLGHPQALGLRVAWLSACLRLGRVEEARRWLAGGAGAPAVAGPSPAVGAPDAGPASIAAAAAPGGRWAGVGRLQPADRLAWWMAVARLAAAAGDRVGADAALRALDDLSATHPEDRGLQRLAELVALELALARGDTGAVLQRLDAALWQPADLPPQMAALRGHLSGLAHAVRGDAARALEAWDVALAGVSAPEAFGPGSEAEARLRLNRALARRALAVQAAGPRAIAAVAPAGAASGPLVPARAISDDETAVRAALAQAREDALAAERIFRGRFGADAPETRLAQWLRDDGIPAEPAPVARAPPLPEPFVRSGLPGGYRP